MEGGGGGAEIRDMADHEIENETADWRRTKDGGKEEVKSHEGRKGRIDGSRGDHDYGGGGSEAGEEKVSILGE